MWVARDENGALYFFYNKPQRHDGGYWISIPCGAIPNGLFPELKWEDEPLKVSIESIKDLDRDYHDLVKYQTKDIKIRGILHEMASRKEELGLTDDVKEYLKRLTDIIYDEDEYW